jgi:aspartate aminotransferase
MKGALAALSGAEEDVRRMIAEYALRRDLFVERLNRIPGVRCRAPHGAFYVFPDVSERLGRTLADTVAFAERLLEEEAVAIVAGEAFGSDRHVRFSFACARPAIDEGMDRVERFFARHA